MMRDNLNRKIKIGHIVFGSICHNAQPFSVVGVVRDLYFDTEQVRVQSLTPGRYGNHPTSIFNPRELIVMDSKTLDTLMLMKLSY